MASVIIGKTLAAEKSRQAVMRSGEDYGKYIFVQANNLKKQNAFLYASRTLVGSYTRVTLQTQL